MICCFLEKFNSGNTVKHEEDNQLLKNNNVKKFLSDTFAMISFSTVFGMLIEVFIAKLTLSQSIQTRLTAAPLNLITARPYGMYRDFMCQKFKISKNDKKKYLLLNILTIITFQMPIYALILLSVKAELWQILKSCLLLIPVAVFLGGPYGLYIDWCRKRLFKVNNEKEEVKNMLRSYKGESRDVVVIAVQDDNDDKKSKKARQIKSILDSNGIWNEWRDDDTTKSIGHLCIRKEDEPQAGIVLKQEKVS